MKKYSTLLCVGSLISCTAPLQAATYEHADSTRVKTELLLLKHYQEISIFILMPALNLLV